MAIIRWEPARELTSFQHEVNRLFGSFFDTPTRSGGARPVRRWVPALDVLEEGEEYVLRADLPGVGDDDVKVEVEEGVLTIAGKRQSEHEERKDGYHRVERFSGSFSRRLTLPEGVDPESIKAHFERGVLEVRIPKPEQRKPRRVAISVGEAAPAIEGKSSEVASSAGAGSDS